MATTTNYGWPTPDDTDLVKDGADAIRTLGSSIDSTTEDLNPATTEGDLQYRGATVDVNERLAIGTAGQILAVNSGADAPEWITGGAPETAYTLLTSTTSTGAATITMSFTACSDLLLQVVSTFAAGASLRVRFNGDSTSNYDQFTAQLGQSGGSGFSINTGNDGFIVSQGTNGDPIGLTMLINGAKKAGFPTVYNQSYYTTGGGTKSTMTNSGIFNVNGPITSISLFNNFSDNFTAMSAKVYGRA